MRKITSWRPVKREFSTDETWFRHKSNNKHVFLLIKGFLSHTQIWDTLPSRPNPLNQICFHSKKTMFRTSYQKAAFATITEHHISYPKVPGQHADFCPPQHRQQHITDGKNPQAVFHTKTTPETTSGTPFFAPEISSLSHRIFTPQKHILLHPFPERFSGIFSTVLTPDFSPESTISQLKSTIFLTFARTLSLQYIHMYYTLTLYCNYYIPLM